MATTNPLIVSFSIAGCFLLGLFTGLTSFAFLRPSFTPESKTYTVLTFCGSVGVISGLLVIVCHARLFAILSLKRDLNDLHKFNRTHLPPPPPPPSPRESLLDLCSCTKEATGISGLTKRSRFAILVLTPLLILLQLVGVFELNATKFPSSIVSCSTCTDNKSSGVSCQVTAIASFGYYDDTFFRDSVDSCARNETSSWEGCFGNCDYCSCIESSYTTNPKCFTFDDIANCLVVVSDYPNPTLSILSALVGCFILTYIVIVRNLIFRNSDLDLDWNCCNRASKSRSGNSVSSQANPIMEQDHGCNDKSSSNSNYEMPSSAAPLISKVTASSTAATTNFVLYNPPESFRSYSSLWNDNLDSNNNSMLDSDSGYGAWMAGQRQQNVNQHMTIDLGSVKSVVGVVTQARCIPYNNQFVKTYKVGYSTDGTKFIFAYAGSTGSETVKSDIFIGPHKNYSLKTDPKSPTDLSYDLDKVNQYFSSSISARYIRLYPQTWSHHISMRAGVLLQGEVTAAATAYFALSPSSGRITSGIESSKMLLLEPSAPPLSGIEVMEGRMLMGRSIIDGPRDMEVRSTSDSAKGRSDVRGNTAGIQHQEQQEQLEIVVAAAVLEISPNNGGSIEVLGESPDNSSDIEALMLFFSRECGLGKSLSRSISRSLVVNHNLCTVKMMRKKATAPVDQAGLSDLKAILKSLGVDDLGVSTITDELLLERTS